MSRKANELEVLKARLSHVESELRGVAMRMPSTGFHVATTAETNRLWLALNELADKCGWQRDHPSGSLWRRKWWWS